MGDFFTAIMWILLEILLQPQILFPWVLICRTVNETATRGPNFLYNYVTVDLFNMVFSTIDIV